jgi:pimeloyl-ACP methyl ester carboxylesterase
LLAAALAASAAQLVMYGDTAERQQIYRMSVAARDAWVASDQHARRLVVAGAADELSVIRLDPPAGGPVPVVAVWGGTSGWGMMYRRCAQALLDAGIGVALVELPGQGEPRLLHRRNLGGDFPDLARALVAALAADEGCSGAVGVWGQSMGGLLAAHVASSAPVAACCVTSAPARPHSLVSRYPRQRQLWADMLGITDARRLDSRLHSLSFDPDRQRIQCPLMVIHGGQDPLVGDDEPDTFLRAGQSPDNRIAIWSDAGHCVYNRGQERDLLVAEWFSAALARTP